VLDGIPLVQYFTQVEVGSIREVDDALTFGIMPMMSSPLDSTGHSRWTLAPTLARAVEAYREARQVFSFEANYTSRGTSAGMLGRSAIGSLRRGPGFVTVGELANLVHGQAPPNYAPGDSTYRIDALNGALGTFNAYPYAVAIMSSLPEWLTVKSNTYTIYATLVDDTDEVEVTRGQWTVDRSRCLYTPSGTQAGLPEIIGPEVTVNAADAAQDPF
jgi:hypothetical protein